MKTKKYYDIVISLLRIHTLMNHRARMLQYATNGYPDKDNSYGVVEEVEPVLPNGCQWFYISSGELHMSGIRPREYEFKCMASNKINGYKKIIPYLTKKIYNGEI